MQRKQGISLIVLVITIIVMIILAAAIILSLNNAGIIGNANKAVRETDYKTVQTAAQLKYAEYILDEEIIDFEKYYTIGDWLKETLISDGTLTEEQANMYKFTNKGEVIRLETEEEYNAKYTVTDPMYYTVTDGVFELTEAGKTLEELVIPYGVTEIKTYTQTTNNTLKKLVMPDTVKIIGSSAFYYEENLAEVVLSKDIREIRGCAFYGTAWSKDSTNADSNGFVIVNNVLVNASKAKGIVEIPKEVEWIGGGAFENNDNIQKVTFPNALKGIVGYAFWDANIGDGELKDKKIIIESGAFAYAVDYGLDFEEKYKGTFWWDIHTIKEDAFLD